MSALDHATLAFASADAHWQLELDRLYGDAAPAARHLACGRGARNSALRSLWNARQGALKAYEVARHHPRASLPSRASVEAR